MKETNNIAEERIDQKIQELQDLIQIKQSIAEIRESYRHTLGAIGLFAILVLLLCSSCSKDNQLAVEPNNISLMVDVTEYQKPDINPASILSLYAFDNPQARLQPCSYRQQYITNRSLNAVAEYTVPTLEESDRANERDDRHFRDKLIMQFNKEVADEISSIKRLYPEYRQLPHSIICLLYTSPSPRDRQKSRMPSSA